MQGEGEQPEPRVAADELRAFARDALQSAGVEDPHATRVSEALVRADLRGVETHGLARLETYVQKFENGGFDPAPEITVDVVGESAVLVDADDGPGQSAGVRAIDAACDIAADHGVGIAGVKNSNHFGTAAYYTERASSSDYVGLAMTNVGSDVAPFGGFEPFLGTNPISFSIPTGRAFPITLDMATSVVAMGTVDHAVDEDEELPESWAFDHEGDPTTDPSAVAALRPVGGPKGYGLAIVVDVLCGVLTGVGTSPSVGPLYEAFDEPMRLGHFFAAIDPSAYRDVESFKTAIGEYVDHIKSQPTREDVDEIRLPGEMEALAMQRNERDGVPLNEDAVDGIRSLADRYGLALPPELP